MRIVSASKSLPSMPLTLPQAKSCVNPFLGWCKMDGLRWRGYYPRMAKTAKKRKKYQPKAERAPKLGKWMAALGVKAVDISKHLGCSEAYLSNLINNRVEKNPSIYFMLDLSDYLGVGINELFEDPPPPADVEPLGRLNRRQWAAILEVQAMRTRKK